MDINVIDRGEITLSQRKTLLELSKDLLFESSIVALINNELTDLTEMVKDGTTIEFLNFSDNRAKEIFWHSTSHIMAYAVKRLKPNVKLGIGPAIEQGFYYDFLTEKPLTEEDLKDIEAEMQRIIEEKIPFQKIIMDKKTAEKYLKESGELLKLELLEEKVEEDEVTFYKLGEFMDLCLGPHIPDTSYIKAFKLLTVAGAYWRGNENNQMLSRVQGISFLDEKELDRYLYLLEEAKKRDHRIIGKNLELFTIDEEAGSGLALWLPDGEFIYKTIEDYWLDLHKKHDYIFVKTPHIYRAELFKKSGHYDYYLENMFTLNIEKQEYVLKPMNCPGHMIAYKSQIRSYRDLPLKITELGTVYRNERSGTLHGLMRVRGFTIDDAHIFCRPDQIIDEICDVIDMSMEMLSAFGFDEYQVELSIRDPNTPEKYIGTDREWEIAESYLIKAMEKKNIDYIKMEGEAVFYGPKIDIKLKDSLERLWQATTIQFDFNLPERFELEYMDKDGEKKNVFTIHRALLGSFERFIGVLIEEYAGAFPVWLSPVQVSILPIAERHIEYSKEVSGILEENDIRVKVDDTSEKLGAKIRDAELKRIPYILIIGDREIENQTVSIRKRIEGDIGSMNTGEFIEKVLVEIKEKRIN